MRKAIIMLVFIFVTVSCTKTDSDRKAIDTTLDSFYENINKRDFKSLNSICSPQMTKWLDFVKTFGDDIVIYKEWESKSVEIKGTKAIVTVVATDQFGNKTECVWKLSKSNDKWLIDVFDNSSADITPDENANQKTEKPEATDKTLIKDSI
jgi:hypothetical protein